MTERKLQRYSSAKTARRQLAGGFKVAASLGAFAPGTINFDVGGGPWDEGTEWLRARGVDNYLVDPFNRTPLHNGEKISALSWRKADSATLFNVLNVIAEDWARREALELAATYTRGDASVWIDVYEGDRSGVGRASTYGWQENRRMRDYLDEVRAVFASADVVGGRIIRARRIS